VTDEIPKHTNWQRDPTLPVDFYKRMPTGGTAYVVDPRYSDVPEPPVLPGVSESNWFRRMPNGGTVYRANLPIPPIKPNGGGTTYVADEADDAGE